MGNCNQRKAKSLAVKVISFLLPLTSYLFFASCTQDGYEKGDGPYSNMRGDFVEALVNADKNIISLTTDDGETLPLAKPYTTKWVTSADTIYRCILYYNKVREGDGRYVAEPISMTDIPCPTIVSLAELETPMKTDPVTFESAWIGKSGKYLNLSFLLLTGSPEEEGAVHRLRVVQDTIITNPDATQTSYLRLYHDQAGVPEYYSTHVYASIITSQIPADSVRISINTYDGTVEKAFLLKNQ